MKNIIKIANKDNSSNIVFIDGSQITISIKPKKLLEKLCIIYGSSLEGRLNSFKAITNAFQKPCILINDDLLFIPTMSINNPKCEFIQYNKIVWIKPIENKSLILFNNGYKLIADCSIKTLRKQVKRCDMFVKKLIEYHRLSFDEFSAMGDF